MSVFQCVVSTSQNAFNWIFSFIKSNNEILVLRNSWRIMLRKIMISKYSNVICES